MVKKQLFASDESQSQSTSAEADRAQTKAIFREKMAVPVGGGVDGASSGAAGPTSDHHHHEDHCVAGNANSKNDLLMTRSSTNSSQSSSTNQQPPNSPRRALYKRSSSDPRSSRGSDKSNDHGSGMAASCRLPMPAYLHRSSTSGPSIPMGWWQAVPDCDLWNERYQMSAYLCSVGRFGKLYTCFHKDTDEELTVKVVRKSRWESSSTRKSKAKVGTTANVTPRTSTHSNTASVTSSTTSTTSNLDQPRQPLRASHYLNQIHPHRHHLQEYSLLKSFSHPHILKLRDDIVMEDSRFYFIVTDYYNPNTQSLQAFLTDMGPQPEHVVAPLAYQMMSCINYCHQRQVVHCNLKLDTFCISQVASKSPNAKSNTNSPTYKITLTDFANAVVLGDLTDDPRHVSQLRLMEPRGAIRYMAPEVVALDQSYGNKCDVWSLGIITYVLMTNTFPLDGSTFLQVKELVLATQQQQQQHWLLDRFRTVPAWQNCSNEGKHLVDRLLAARELERPSPEQALQHPWLQPYWAFSLHHSNTTTTNAGTEAPSSEYLTYGNSQHDMIEAKTPALLLPQLSDHNSRNNSMEGFLVRQSSGGSSTGTTIGNNSSFFTNSNTTTTPLPLAVIQEISTSSSQQQLAAFRPEDQDPLQLMQREAIDAFIHAHTSIRQEWTTTNQQLQAHGLPALESTTELTRPQIKEAYAAIFQCHLTNDDLDRVLQEFDALQEFDRTSVLQGVDFFVAALNEKDLLFTHALQEAFEVFDTNHSGLVACADLMQALEAYMTSEDDSDNTDSTKSRVLRELGNQIETEAQEVDKTVLALEELVAMILETAIPKSITATTTTTTDEPATTTEITEPIQQEQQEEPPNVIVTSTSSKSASSSSAHYDNINTTPLTPPPTPPTTTHATHSGGSAGGMIAPSPSWESSVSGTSHTTHSRRSSFRLSLKFSAKLFIAQRPGRLSHHYELLEFVNEGGCGAVWFCRHKETGAERAVKLVRKAQKDVDYNRRILDEFLILRELDHPNILKQFELFEDANFFYIVMDAARGGDLCDELDEFGAFVEHAAAVLMKQLLSCINYLHSINIVHCDLKPENILLEANKELSQIKVIDFGFAANIKKAPNQRLTRRWGTIHYSAPEVFAGDYGKKADMWSAGVIAFLLLSDEFPFHGNNKHEIMTRVLSGDFSFDSPQWNIVSEMGKDFVNKLLTVDETKRMSAEEALQHPWIRSAAQKAMAAMRPADFEAMTMALSNLMKFSANSKLKQATYSLIASQLLEKKEKEAIDSVFRRLDVTCNGRLSRTEIRLALKNFIGADLSDEEVDEVFERVDVASTGFIEYSEFVVAAMNEDDFLMSEKYRRAFDTWDVNKTGFITSENLKAALSHFLTGEDTTDEAIIAKIFSEVDTNNDGLISFEEFTAEMTSRTDASTKRQQESKRRRSKGFLGNGLPSLLMFAMLIMMVDSFSLGQGSRVPPGTSTWGRNHFPRSHTTGLESAASPRQQPRSNGEASPFSSAQGKPTGICHSRQTLTPDQVFYPHMASVFDASEDDADAACLGGVPLFQGLRRLQGALERIARANADEIQAIWGDPVSSDVNVSSGTQTLRIEQVLSHSVDPLGWLYAQNKCQLYSEPDKKDPLFYIQSTAETAVFGAAWTWVKPTKGCQEFWETVNSLPKDSYLYGGERFDVESLDVDKRVDWKDFGATWWVLPAFELREEPTEQVIQRAQGRKQDRKRTTLSVHLAVGSGASNGIATSWQEAARRSLDILQRLSDAVTDGQVPATTLPPVIMRESSYGGIDGQDLYEQGVTAALEEFEKAKEDDSGLKKVVLARRMDLQFQAELSALDILRKWKYNDVHEGGNLFYMRPLGMEEFFGCTPERLFTIQKNSNVVLTEALAGTRPRGTTQAADDQLLRDLFGSMKDRSENAITANFIREVFAELGKLGLVRETDVMLPPTSSSLESGDGYVDRESASDGNTAEIGTAAGTGYFVRRLRHLQHICQRFSARLSGPNGGDNADASVLVSVVQHLLANLHPTPAVNGVPAAPAMAFIREKESIGFDRGFYAGPVGYLGRSAADILVAIRSGLASPSDGISSADGMYAGSGDLSGAGPSTKVSVYAGAGLVPGSTVQGEWAETSYKLGVVSSLFPQSPITLQSAPTPNVAWASAFIEELIRNGITQFYVCPGSRSTPLVVAIARAARANVGVVNAVSVHDERSAGFRAIGYGRGANRPAAIITSSGTAIANLYPAVVEAGMDGVPMVLLTADRPYENRDTGANQAIDQVKAYSASYIRWFRDILPPHDDVPVSVALADATHAVEVSKSQRGPVHLNIQFRENLAPDVGPIRNDNRADSVTRFNGVRYTDVPGFTRWSTSGDRWLQSYAMSSGSFGVGASHAAIIDLARLILESKRGIIVIGNIRRPTDENSMDSVEAMYESITSFAETTGFPIVAGAQNAHLRFSSDAVIPFAEHILRNPKVAQNIKPDLIIQIGAPLVSTEVPSMISNALQSGDSSACHVLIHPHHGAERADPSFTVSRKISAEVSPFLKELSKHLDTSDLCKKGCGSQLAPLLLLGRRLQKEMAKIINEASASVSKLDPVSSLTEPQVVLALSMMMSSSIIDQSLFFSNSMPIRDAEFFLYPTGTRDNSTERGVFNVGSNRGASGIDGIIASATGFAESTGVSTTLLIGDLAALHDLNSLHALSSGTTSSKKPLTIILVNNDGGGIFSFLPIAKHGTDVSFNDFFGTPTSSFSFEDGADAFDLPNQQASRFDSFCKAYVDALRSDRSALVEARVVGRESNVAVHQRITQNVNAFIEEFLAEDKASDSSKRLPVKFHSQKNQQTNGAVSSDEEIDKDRKTLVLIHGWMGDKTEWDNVGETLSDSLSPEWDVVAVDLPGHGETIRLHTSDSMAVKSALNFNSEVDQRLSVDEMAKSVLTSLSKDYGITTIDALAGYSLGGRVALAMKRLCSTSSESGATSLVRGSTKLVLLSAYPGNLPQADGKLQSGTTAEDGMQRVSKDEKLACRLGATWNRDCMSLSPRTDLWSEFLNDWYSMPMWGELWASGTSFDNMVEKRLHSLSYRGNDLAEVLRKSSPPRNSKEDWRGAQPENTLFVAGEQDSKYAEIGRRWSQLGVRFVEVPNAGHALLVEASDRIAAVLSKFILSETALINESLQAEGRLSSTETPKFGSQKRQLAKDQDIVDASTIAYTEAVTSLEYEPFVIDTVDENRQRRGVLGIGWGDKAKRSSQMTSRSGFILQIVGSDGSRVGVGEVSPLPGLHKESLSEAEEQLVNLKRHLDQKGGESNQLEVSSILAADGALTTFIDRLAKEAGVRKVTSSVRAGLEMALVSLASQVVQSPIHQALVKFAPEHSRPSTLDAILPVNGLITRGTAYASSLQLKQRRMFPSLKVKVGDTAKDDALSLSQALQQSESYRGPRGGVLRADANRAWTEEAAMEFVTALKGTDAKAMGRLEFVEEPLQRQDTHGWSLENQVAALERWHEQTGIPWALDESFDDLAQQHNHQIASMKEEISRSFRNGNRGCSAFVLKPSLLGLELTLQIARFARSELGIGVAISSSFDSGIGLAYAAILAALIDATGDAKRFPHGVGTFTMLDGDTLRPSFASYVNEQGFLNVLSLSRALNGLGLDELKDSFVFFDLPAEDTPTGLSPSLLESTSTTTTTTTQGTDDFEASTSTSSSGREIQLVASLPLPFSAEIGCARFTDFPQQSRWSPWVQSVRYLDDGRETEWTLNVRGVQFNWRALGKPLQPPNKGIEWEAVSGLQNKGIVEFVEAGVDSSIMKVRMTIMAPRILATLFQTNVFVVEFLQNKLLKWSLEMFRDVVKGDLALERGDVELGDALFGSVEGKATAIQAALSLSPLPKLSEDKLEEATDDDPDDEGKE